MTIRANGTSITPSSRKSPDLRVETRRPWPTRSGRCSACRNGSRPEGRDEVGIPGFAHDVSVRRTDLDLEGRDEQPVSPCRTSRPVSSNGSRPGGSRRWLLENAGFDLRERGEARDLARPRGFQCAIDLSRSTLLLVRGARARPRWMWRAAALAMRSPAHHGVSDVRCRCTEWRWRRVCRCR